MAEKLIATSKTSIGASKEKVWEALVTPSAIKDYMFGADVQSGWTKGSPIVWKGEYNGRPYEDKGVILSIDPNTVLQYSHYSPMAGKPDMPENYHTVTVALSGRGDETAVTLSQDNNADEAEREQSQTNWDGMLASLKKHVEKSS